MAAVELESSPRIVIEVPEFPVSQAVAVLTFRTQPAQMLIVFLVASVAGRGRLVLIQQSRVAALASSGSMFSL